MVRSPFKCWLTGGEGVVVIPGEFPEGCLQGRALLILCHLRHIIWIFQNCPVIWSASLVVTQEWITCRSDSSAHPVHRACREASHSWNEGFVLSVTLSFHSLKQRQCCRSWAAQWEASNSGLEAKITCSHSVAARKPWVTQCSWGNLALRCHHRLCTLAVGLDPCSFLQLLAASSCPWLTSIAGQCSQAQHSAEMDPGASIKELSGHWITYDEAAQRASECLLVALQLPH